MKQSSKEGKLEILTKLVEASEQRYQFQKA
jgi:hypothetical protein